VKETASGVCGSGCGVVPKAGVNVTGIASKNEAGVGVEEVEVQAVNKRRVRMMSLFMKPPYQR
jgi:hypothetical protein